jgi:hypothetical protein
MSTFISDLIRSPLFGTCHQNAKFHLLVEYKVHQGFELVDSFEVLK